MIAVSSLKYSLRRSVPIIMQSEHSECGLACLAMIASYFGKNINLNELRLLLGNNGNGINLKELAIHAKFLGLSSRALRVEIENLKELLLPVIIHWNFNHFVVLTKVYAHKVEIIDPGIGKRTVSLSEFGRHFTGIALELKPNDDFKTQDKSKGPSLWQIIRNTRNVGKPLSILLSLSFVLQLIMLSAPFYIQSVIDLAVLDNDESLLTILAIGFGLILIFEVMCTLVRDNITLRFSSKLNLSFSHSLFEHLIRLPTQYFQHRHLGDIVSRFSSLHKIREVITSGIISAIIDGVMALTAIIVMSFYSITLTGLVFASVVIYSTLRWITYKPQQELEKISLQNHAEESTYFMQSVKAIKTIKLGATEQRTTEKWLSKLVTAMNQDIKLSIWRINLNSLHKILFGAEHLIVVYLAATLVMSNTLSIGMLFAFISYKTRFTSSIENLTNRFLDFKILTVHLERLSDILTHSTEESGSLKEQLNNRFIDHSKAFPAHKNAIEVNRLNFAYHNRQTNVLSNISFTARPGQNIAIIGKSGSGKSTLLLCLLGLHVPTSGEVLCFGRPLSASFRKENNISAVLQDDQVLNGSIMDNISDFDNHVDLKRVTDSAKLACLHEDIMQMTMQYQSMIGDMGANLSGGQKQRLMIARALYKNPKILMLDEATSHLDIETEKKINANLKNCKIAKIVIAHRYESIRQADTILELKNGHLTDVTEHFFKRQL